MLLTPTATPTRNALPLVPAAPQHNTGLVLSLLRGHAPLPPPSVSDASSRSREVFIQGLTRDGRTFRPSDWAERLAGAMSCFRPGGVKSGIGAHLGYSPYCVPTSLGDVRCVVVNEALRKVEPMAWDFVMNFARDNDLQVFDACLLPDVAVPPRKKR
jgi:hypothetical protein